MFLISGSSFVAILISQKKLCNGVGNEYLPFNFFDDTATHNFFTILNPFKYPKHDMKRRVLKIFKKKRRLQ